MTDPASRRSALAHLQLGARPPEPNASVRIGERPFTAKIDLRGGPEVAQAAGGALGFVLPSTIGWSSFGEGAHALMLGPDQWWITAEPGFEEAIANELELALTELPHAVVDISERMTVIILEGRLAREVMAAGCPLDLHPRVFRPGQVASSHLGKVPITIHYVAGNDAHPFFDLYVNRSLADYAWRYLEASAREYGFAIVP